ncbi:MAG TPA: hypothetical protein VMZ05_05745 [Spirochaetota bacterium]|nr:hypothetical protein [Spirochaetota bacterium]
MKRVPILIALLLFVFSTGALMAQQTVRLGDLPKSDYIIQIYQVIGFQEGVEGYRITFIDQKNEPNYIYLPTELRNRYEVYRPQLNTYAQNFFILWQKGGKIERVEWYMPPVINYKLPYFAIKPFGEKDKEIFKAIVNRDEIVLGTDIGGLAPQIRAPGGGE